MTSTVEHMDDTAVNVVDYFKDGAMGRTRRYACDISLLDLDGTLEARDIHAEFRLSRVGAGLLAEGIVTATVELQCVRTLDYYPEHVEAEFAEQFRPMIDAQTGRDMGYEDVPEAEPPEYFFINENHLLDVTEALRQVIVVALPMQPVKPGTKPVLLDETGGDADTPDVPLNPFAALSALLREGDE